MSNTHKKNQNPRHSFVSQVVFSLFKRHPRMYIAKNECPFQTMNKGLSFSDSMGPKLFDWTSDV